MVAFRIRRVVIAASLLLPAIAQMPPGLKTAINKTCLGCHSGAAAKGGLDFATLSSDLGSRVTRDRWVRVHDRIEKGEMPPKGVELAAADRTAMLRQLEPLLHKADRADVAKNGRGPMRRVNRDEYEQDLRDILRLPYLDIRDMLPEDREAHHFNKVSETLDMSRVQLAAYLDASEAALRQAMATAPAPPDVTTFRASGTNLFPGFRSTGTIQSMFFIKDNQGVNVDQERWTPLPKEACGVCGDGPVPFTRLALRRVSARLRGEARRRVPGPFFGAGSAPASGIPGVGREACRADDLPIAPSDKS